eukprot:CAMPEP_0183291822 /NCGR_PEP_ID=MMETSP0160_2-20130417/1100_1 /TAXON_ID=2839 ORGANISM="Odontella Sinensis, Strain Grunow 1884" /NCGR_SAMPLE_ID=MMETSP0160_2 /ASSEMBLY_ACC=CAM_ASM_000250 /LENGTH=508 /DNA_ID=CAMNT_0025452679 /DNA_START=160 /DNA_END=1686 /DNA_ORIENTATION=+
MRVSHLAALFLLSGEGRKYDASAFTVPTPFASRRTAGRTSSSSMSMAASSSSSSGGEFDHLFGENWQVSRTSDGGFRSSRRRSAVVAVPDGSPAVTLTSAVAEEAAVDEYAAEEEGDFDAAAEDEGSAEGSTAAVGGGGGPSDAFVASDAAIEDDLYVREVLRKKQLREIQKSPSFDPKSLIEGKDFTDIFFTIVMPLGLGLYGAKWAADKGAAKLAETADDKLDAYAGEMVYHDGDLDEMRMCHGDYKKKLAWLGPGKKRRMIHRYLETFAKKVTVSPQSISSLSYAFSLYKLSEDKAAQILSDLCLAMPEKTASTGKLLFFGNHILKSPEARAKLEPIREMLASSYRDDVGISGEDIVDKSQKAMGEAAYREAVTKAGKDQTSLTPGWEVLGLTKEDAQRIWDEEEESGFVSSMEAKYSRAKLKYNDKGQRLDELGDVKPGQEDLDGNDDGSEVEASSSGAYECGQCGFTMFVAPGREKKFFGPGFKCPECGAAKDQFVGKNVEDQ